MDIMKMFSGGMSLTTVFSFLEKHLEDGQVYMLSKSKEGKVVMNVTAKENIDFREKEKVYKAE